MALEPLVVRPAPHPYSHPLIDWGAAIAGTVVAVAIGFALLVLGVAIGATAMNPWQGTSEQAPAWTIGGGLWLIFSNLVALQVGAFVAVRGARWPDHHSGMLQGLIVWALAFTLAAGVLGFGVSGILAGADGMTIEETASRAVNAAQAATGEATGAAATLTPAEVDAVQDATALTAWWAFAMMVLGAVGAIAGGKLGSDHPDWHERERLPRPVTMADKV
ncbi:MAG TPA: hypothetical protein PLH23_16310 [Hyphomonadaceae bacterium]|nr:hypothetical protein [Hyphomonadaceae bacterium]HPI49837.1 hypothetical protein [Hyphomonadaceae bacterium]